MDLLHLACMSTAFVLGLRHGIDWDHIAAITDIVSAVTNQKEYNKPHISGLQVESLVLATCYAIGHAAIVIVLGIAAICFRTILPSWIDGVMERIVGITLLVLGAWVFYSLTLFLHGKRDFQLKSRWAVIGSFIRQIFRKVQDHLWGLKSKEPFKIEKYGPSATFGIGVIHGIGAETGTQVLLIAAVGGASQSIGIAMLLSFAFGLIISNSVIATLGICGFSSSAMAKPMYLTTGILTGVFSIVIGAFFILGRGDVLSSLQKLLGA